MRLKLVDKETLGRFFVLKKNNKKFFLLKSNNNFICDGCFIELLSNKTHAPGGYSNFQDTGNKILYIFFLILHLFRTIIILFFALECWLILRTLIFLILFAKDLFVVWPRVAV